MRGATIRFIPIQYELFVNMKGKAIPIQAWTGPEGSRRLRFPGFKIGLDRP